MTYRCGIGPGLGLPQRDPHFVCDACGVYFYLKTNRPPPAWFLDGQPPRGWRASGEQDQKKTHACARCVSEAHQP